MKVLILGAAGYIGFPTAQAFVRAGHEVYGQSRNNEKSKMFEAEEIIPVIANPANGTEWQQVAEKVDVIIDCIGGNDISTLSEALFKTAVSAATHARGGPSPALFPKLTYIYCGGTWVHGDDRTNTTSERSLPKNTTTLVSWRPALEHAVLSSPVIDGIVVRPSMVYGHSGSLTAKVFQAAESAKAGGDGGEGMVWPGRAGGRWAMVHCDDLADLFVRVAEASPICKGLVFDAANDHTESMDDILATAAKIVGVTAGFRYRQPLNALEEAMTVTTLLRPSLARSLVGWRPRKPSFVEGMSTFYAAYKASLA